MNTIDQVPEQLRGPLLQEVEKMQMTDSFRMYNELVETCFARCVGTFHGKQLEAGEEKCLTTCAAKFMNVSKRVGQRWQEAQAEMQEQMVSKVQQLAAGQQQPPQR